MGKKIHGRRRPDQPLGDIPDDIKIGDYWKVLDADGKELRSDAPSNLTGQCWYVVVPCGRGDEAHAFGYLKNHTVREHEDGTISVLPGDGSSNSILVTRRAGESWHGYIRHGVFEEC